MILYMTLFAHPTNLFACVVKRIPPLFLLWSPFTFAHNSISFFGAVKTVLTPYLAATFLIWCATVCVYSIVMKGDLLSSFVCLSKTDDIVNTDNDIALMCFVFLRCVQFLF